MNTLLTRFRFSRGKISILFAALLVVIMVSLEFTSNREAHAMRNPTAVDSSQAIDGSATTTSP